jgi:hypothetical protein
MVFSKRPQGDKGRGRASGDRRNVTKHTPREEMDHALQLAYKAQPGRVAANDGSTVVSTAIAHFQDSENGNRRDYLDTTLANPTNSIGSFTFHGVELALH